MSTSEPSNSTPPEAVSDAIREDFEPVPLGPTLTALALTLILPGAGHVRLGRVGRGVVFFLLVLTAVGLGLLLEGKLYRPLPGQPLTWLGTVGSLGLGALYFVLRFGFGWEGAVDAAGYEYGTAFLLTAGLMNLLLLLDVWDLARTGKE